MINRQSRAWRLAVLAGAAFLVAAGCEPAPAGGSSSGSSSSRASQSSSGSSSSQGSQSSSGNAASSLSLSATRKSLSEQNPITTLTASRGSGNYAWGLSNTRAVSNEKGVLNVASSGTSATYTATKFGAGVTQVVTVYDTLLNTEKSVTLSQETYAGGDTINIGGGSN